MLCPYCRSDKHGVLESRLGGDGESIRRRRECDQCKKRFTTYERVEGIDLVVIKKDGNKEPFDREKIKKGLMKATWKRPVGVDQIEALINEVEVKLRSREGTEVKSWEVGRLVINRLKKMDKVGYLLFATVYKDFESLEDFRREIDSLTDVTEELCE